MKKLAITGITGKSGRYFFQYLIENETFILEKWKGIKLNIRDEKKADFLTEIRSGIPIEYIYGDLHRQDVSDELLKECDTLFHIAGIQESINLVNSGIRNGVKRVILVHTTGIYSKYKKAGEDYRNIDARVSVLTKKHHIALSILRPTMIYGTMTDHNISFFIKMVDKFRIVPTVNGAHYELQPVHCADLGRAFYQVLMSPEKCNNHNYILSGGEPIELREIFETIAKNLGVKRKYFSCPFGIAYTGAWVIFLLTLKRIDYREKVQRLCEPRIFSYKKAARDFSYAPMTFQEGVIKEVKEYLMEKKKRQDHGRRMG